MLEKYLVSSVLRLPFHFYTASPAPQNLSDPETEDYHPALNALPCWKLVPRLVY